MWTRENGIVPDVLFKNHLLMAGADVESVLIILGNSDLETTKRYLSVTDKHLNEIVDLVGFTDKIERGKVLPFRYFLSERGDFFWIFL